MEAPFVTRLEICRNRRHRAKASARLQAASLDWKASIERSQRMLDSIVGEVDRHGSLADEFELCGRLNDVLLQVERLSKDARRLASVLGAELPDPALFGAEPDTPLSQDWSGP